MNLNEKIIREALRSKGITAQQMCKDIELTEPSLYRFYKSGRMRTVNERKIKEYLGLDIEETKETKDENVSSVSQDLSVVDKLLKRIEELSLENYLLKSKLGKFDSTLYALTA